jgi:hypothetical protein
MFFSSIAKPLVANSEDSRTSSFIRKQSRCLIEVQKFARTEFRTTYGCPVCIRNSSRRRISPGMKPIMDYWENTYVGRRLEGVVPRYAISMWNSFDRLNSDIPRTNNSLEAWHNAFQKTVDCHRPSLVKLLNKFQLEQNQSENFMLRY